MITGMGFYVDYVMMNLEEGMVDGGRSSPHGALCLVLVHLRRYILYAQREYFCSNRDGEGWTRDTRFCHFSPSPAESSFRTSPSQCASSTSLLESAPLPAMKSLLARS